MGRGTHSHWEPLGPLLGASRYGAGLRGPAGKRELWQGAKRLCCEVCDGNGCTGGQGGVEKGSMKDSAPRSGAEHGRDGSTRSTGREEQCKGRLEADPQDRTGRAVEQSPTQSPAVMWPHSACWCVALTAVLRARCSIAGRVPWCTPLWDHH